MIYLDYNATTPVAPEVLEAMLPFFGPDFGNSASRQHRFGWIARDAVEEARGIIARAIGAEAREIVFTSGATESCNLAMKGVFNLYQRKGKHVVVARTEHKAVLDVADFLRKRGAEISYLDVDADGMIDLGQLETLIRDDTVLVCVMWANNETGVVQPVEQIGRICEERGTLFFCDATQAVGKLPVDPRAAGIQLMAFSAHKIYGPKGIGALYVSQASPKVKLQPLVHGGGHEGGMRSGTLNVPGIVGFGAALRSTQAKYPSRRSELTAMRDRLEDQLVQLPDVHINGSGAQRMAHVSNIRFEFVDGAALMASLQNELAVASGSACTSADPSPSHVLLAMGLTPDQVKSSIRISLGMPTTEAEVERAAALLADHVARLRDESPAWQMHRSGMI